MRSGQKRRLGVAFVIVGLAFVGLFSAIAGASTITAKALTDHECDSTEWHFVITQVDTEAQAPASIHVTWANGSSADVPLDKYTGKTAHYATTLHLDSTVTSATASIYAGWDGQFNLSHGPCEVATTTTTLEVTTSTQPATTTIPDTSTTVPETSSTIPEETTIPELTTTTLVEQSTTTTSIPTQETTPTTVIREETSTSTTPTTIAGVSTTTQSFTGSTPTTNGPGLVTISATPASPLGGGGVLAFTGNGRTLLFGGITVLLLGMLLLVLSLCKAAARGDRVLEEGPYT